VADVAPSRIFIIDPQGALATAVPAEIKAPSLAATMQALMQAALPDAPFADGQGKPLSLKNWHGRIVLFNCGRPGAHRASTRIRCCTEARSMTRPPPSDSTTTPWDAAWENRSSTTTIIPSPMYKGFQENDWKGIECEPNAIFPECN
jgi:hypothetical protein